MKHLMLYEDWCHQGSINISEAQINEGLLSDTLHFVGDIAAGVMDTVVPGSGAVVDVINMLSYFAEAYNSKERSEKIKLILSGLIQAFAIFDPFNAIAALKIKLGTFFTWLKTKNPQTVAAARLAAESIKVGLELINTYIVRLAGRIITALADSKFGSAVKWLSTKLGIPNVLAWLKTFLTQTVPTYIKEVLTHIKNITNPSATGTGVGEWNEFLIKASGKVAVSHETQAFIHQKATAFGNSWMDGSFNLPGQTLPAWAQPKPQPKSQSKSK
jgi:hypothetical protein